MKHERKMQLVEAQLECADKSLRAAIGNMGSMAGHSHYAGSLDNYKKLVSTHLKLQSALDEIRDFNEWASRLTK